MLNRQEWPPLVAIMIGIGIGAGIGILVAAAAGTSIGWGTVIGVAFGFALSALLGHT